MSEKTGASQAFLAIERKRIWQTYKTGGLHVEAATAQLLRLDIDERAAARYIRQTIDEYRETEAAAA